MDARDVVLDRLREHVQRIPRTRCLWVAYSGGVDSHVLLHALTKLRAQFPGLMVKALHVHHGLLPQADAWVEHCRQVCQVLDVDIHVAHVDINQSSGESLEALARKARYDVFVRAIRAGEYLLTAHHQDDQAETLLLQLFRGAGLKGLASMPVHTTLGNGYLLRPFLRVTRHEIMQYAQHYDLHWIEDSSNDDKRFTRNFMRHDVMPVLQKRWPQVGHVLLRTASHCAEADRLLSDLAAIDMLDVRGDKSHTLSVSKLRALSVARQKNVLRVWLHQADFLLASSVQLERIVRDVIYAREDAMPCVRWEGVEIKRYGDLLYAIPPRCPHDVHYCVAWDGRQPLTLPAGLGVLHLDALLSQGMLPPEGVMQVRFRRGGERCYLPGREGGRSLKKLMQEWHIPPWERDCIPLIFVEDVLWMVVGYTACIKKPAC